MSEERTSRKEWTDELEVTREDAAPGTAEPGEAKQEPEAAFTIPEEETEARDQDEGSREIGEPQEEVFPQTDTAGGGKNGTVGGALSEKRNKTKKTLYNISLCAVFIALAVVAKLFLSIKIPLLGGDGMRVGLSGVFTAFPAIICGPVYGGVASALSDLLGYLIKPDGSYIPWLTLTAFAGGCLKGIIWMLFIRRARKRTRAVALACFILAGVLGGAVHISLISDGILNDITASQTELATRGMLEAGDYSPLSEAVISLAKYNNDSYTVISVGDAEKLSLPDKISVDGYTRAVTKIGGGAFSACSSVKSVYIPSCYTQIDESAFSGLDITKITVISGEGSAAEDFAEKSGMEFRVSEYEVSLLEVSSKSGGNADENIFKANGFTVKSSDTYRKNLCGYISFLTVGLEAVSVIGILYFALESLICRLEKRKDLSGSVEKHLRAVNPQLVKVMLATVISGVVVTTVNTRILQLVLAVYSGRSFMILWIPRVVEEIAVCMVQSFLISLLYGFYLGIAEKKPGKRVK